MLPVVRDAAAPLLAAQPKVSLLFAQLHPARPSASNDAISRASSEDKPQGRGQSDLVDQLVEANHDEKAMFPLLLPKP